MHSYIPMSWILLLVISSCQSHQQEIPIEGTWKLISGTLIENGDTVVTNYNENLSFIKIINNSHFAFMLHDLSHGADSNAVYSSGGGTYSLTGTSYTEHLEYCSDRSWEGHDFEFSLKFKNDTLIQSGIEKVGKINRINTEKYVRITETIR